MVIVKCYISIERFLKDLLEKVSKGLNARIQLQEMSAVAQQELAEEQQKQLKEIKVKSEQVITVINS